MEFEWDESKNQLNQEKHGIAFEDVVYIFNDWLYYFLDDSEDYVEDRFHGYGILNGRFIVVAFIQLEINKVRIISARKALKHEVKLYVNKVQNRLGAN